MSIHWTLAGVWNKSYDLLPEKEVRPRDYMYASELCGAFLDRYLKMLGTKYTNPPTGRSERKFEGGTLLEQIIKDVFIRLGLLKEHHRKVKYALSGCIPVSGESDFIVGGTELDFDAAENHLNKAFLPPRTKERCFIMLSQMREAYAGIVLKEYVFELKSVSSFVFDLRERAGCGYKTHEIQTFHYAKGFEQMAKLGYICRDDMRIQEFLVDHENAALQATYTKDVETMTDLYVQKIQPPPEEPILFDDDACTFSLNKKIEWSPYLEMCYGFKTPEDFRTKYAKFVGQINRVYKRCVNCDNMTKQNKEIIFEAKKTFPHWDDLVDLGKIAGIMTDETDED